MRRYIFILFCAIALPLFSASVVRQAKDAIKKKSNIEQAIKALLAEVDKPDVKPKDKVEYLQLAAECSERLYEIENTKLYLKQKYDTTKFYASILDIYAHVLKADSIGASPDEKGRVRPINRRHNRDFLMPYRTNLLNGGRWHFSGGRMPQAYQFFDVYVSVATHPIFARDTLLRADTLIGPTAYLAVVSAYRSQNNDGIIKHASLAKSSHLKSQIVQEYLCKAWQAKGDSVRWLSALEDGLRDYPQHDYFFSHLIDYYVSERRFDTALEMTDSMLAKNDSVPLYWYAKSLVLLKQSKDREAIDACDSCLALEPDYVDALYTKGIASLNLAVIYADTACSDLTNPQCRRDQEIIRSLYMLAKQPMERVRQLQPDAVTRWAAPLYRIYLNLNMGHEFEEIDYLLNSQKP